MPGSLFIEGDSITLRTIEAEDMEFFQHATNDPAVREGMTTPWPYNAEQRRDYFEERVSDRSFVNLAICSTDETADEATDDGVYRRRGGEMMGAISLHNIMKEAGSAELGLWLAPEFQGNGYGTEASRLMTRYAFDELRLHRIQACVLATSEPSHRVWEKLGYEKDGVHRDEAFTDGEYVDVHYYSTLSHEWDR